MMSLAERKKSIELALSQGKKVIMYITDDTKSAQFRYRCQNVTEAVLGSELRVIWFLKTEICYLDIYLEKIHLIIIGRQTDKDGKIGKFIKKAHMMGVAVVFDLDDLVFDYRNLPVLMWSINSYNILYWVGYFWGIRRIAKKVDGFICTNEFLAKKLRKSFNKTTKIIPNSLNKKQVDISAKLVKKKKAQKKPKDKFLIGYFSGSLTHVKDFKLVEPDLVRLFEDYNDINLRIVGYMKLSRRMKRLLSEGKVEMIQPVDYVELQKLIADVDVNIAPLLVNDFTNCKSELKFFEAAIVETVTVASPNYAFKRNISNGSNGFLAAPGEWYKKIKYLYDNTERRGLIALEAKDYALTHYYGKNFLTKVKEALIIAQYK